MKLSPEQISKQNMQTEMLLQWGAIIYCVLKVPDFPVDLSLVMSAFMFLFIFLFLSYIIYIYHN